MTDFIIESDRQVRHKSIDAGVVITRTQVVRNIKTGQRFECDFYSHWDTGRLDHVSSTPIN